MIETVVGYKGQWTRKLSLFIALFGYEIEEGIDEIGSKLYVVSCI